MHARIRPALLAALVTVGALGHAQTKTYAISMDGGQSGTGSPGTGFATLVVDTSSGAVSLSGTYSGLNGTQTVAHIHGPTTIGGSAGIILGLTGTGGTSGTVTGSGTLTAGELADLLAARYYVNVHSTTNTGGEIRGHIVQEFNVDCPAELVTDPVLADTGGDSTFGPRIGNATQRFNLSLDCSGAGASSIFAIELRLGKLAVPSASIYGDVWFSGPKLFSRTGPHSQNVVSAFPGAGLTVPNDVSFVGTAYTAQGFCGDPSSVGRLSNAIVQVVGI